MKKIGFLLSVILAVSGCVSTGNSPEKREKLASLFNETTPFEIPIFAKLEKIDGNYIFSEFTLEKPHITISEDDAWVNLFTGKPVWHFQEIQRCDIITATGEDSKTEPCTLASESRFMKRNYDVAVNVGMTVVTAGLMNLVKQSLIVEFDPDSFMNAFNEANGRLSLSQAQKELKFNEVSSYLSKMQNQYITVANEYESLIQTVPKNFMVPNFPVQDFDLSERYKSLESLGDSLDRYGQGLNRAEKIISELPIKIREHKEKEREILAKQKKEKAVRAREERTLAQQVDLKNMNDLRSAEEYISKYQYGALTNKELFNKGVDKYRFYLNEEYVKDFGGLTHLQSHQRFVKKYKPLIENIDDRNLFMKAQKNLRKIEENIKQKELAKKELARQEELARNKKEQDEFIRLVKNFRAKISEGDFSHCGLVVETKTKVARVQTMVGAVFISIDHLYPEGSTNCTFYNGVYQRPEGLPI